MDRTDCGSRPALHTPMVCGCEPLTLPAPRTTVRLRSIGLIAALALCGCASTPAVPPQFKVGDIAVARHFGNYPELNGTQVRVTGEYKWRWIKGGNTLRCYAIQTVDGQELAAQGFQLQVPTSTHASAATIN